MVTRAILVAGAALALACTPRDIQGGGSGGTSTHALNVRVSGNGSGEVRSTAPAFTCNTQCTQSVSGSAQVQLVATAASGSTFAGWQGACSGIASCTVTMDADRDVTATFSTLPPPPVGMARVSVEFPGTGVGRVTSSPAGIDCPGTCSMTVTTGTNVSLSSQADGNSSFAGWGGACSGNAGCSFSASGNQTVWANFEKKAPPPANSCAGIAAPDDVAMQQYVRKQDGKHYECLAGLGDASGTMAFPRAFQDSSSQGSSIEFVTTKASYLHDQYDSSSLPRPLQQPAGLLVWGGTSRMNPRQDEVPLVSFDSSGNPAGNTTFWAKNVGAAEDPAGGALFAGDISLSSSGPYSHSAVMFKGGGATPSVRWGPKPLASNGTVFGLGVDVLGRSLVITDGAPKLGGGNITAQWFDKDGTALTGEFVLLTGFVAGQSTWFETSPLVGGGVMVRRMDGSRNSQALVVVPSGKDTVQPAPDWMVARSDRRLQLARGGRAYAVLPYGATGVDCTQRLEILAPDGTSCGTRDYAIASGKCDTMDLTLGADGTVIQQLPSALESITPVSTHTCTWRWWTGAVK
jgi:hypothetical protein